MVKLVNEELFSLKTEKKSGTYGEFYSTTFATKVKAPDKKNEGEKKARILVGVNHSKEDSLNKENTRIRVEQQRPGLNSIRIRQADNYQYDTNVYLIAIPFCGIVNPMEKSYDYRVYKAFVMKSDKYDIEVGGQKYNKVAYMIVTLNNNLFKEDNEHHKDHLELKFETFNLATVEGQEEKETVKTIYSITFDKDGEYSIDITTEKTDAVDSKDFKGQLMFQIFEPKAKSDSDEDGIDSKKDKKFNKEKKPFKKDDGPKVNGANTGKKANYEKPGLRSTKDDGRVVYSSSDGDDVKSSILPEGTTLDNLEEMLNVVRKQEKESRRDREKRKGKKKGKHRR